MALIMFIMAILSQAFVAATGVFRNLKAAGDMAEKLRATTTLLQRDLAADHFEGKKRLSDPSFWLNGPPQQGFFRIWQGSAGVAEGNPSVDTDNFGSFRSTNHMLAFTIKLRGNQMSDFLTAGSQGNGATLPPPSTLSGVGIGGIANIGPAEVRYQSTGNYNFQWAEVTWFLQPQVNAGGVQDTTVNDPATGSAALPLFTLYRNQRLAVPDNSLVPPQAYTAMNNPAPPLGYLQLQSLFAEVSSWANPQPSSLLNAGNLYFNNPIDLTVPTRRFGMTPTNYSGPNNGGAPAPANPAGVPLSFFTGFPPASYLWPNGLAWNYFGVAQMPAYPTLAQLGANGIAGADIQLTNVVSFDVRLLVSGIAPSSGSLDPFVTLLTPTNPLLPANNTTNPPLFGSYGNQAPQVPGQAYNPQFNMITGPMVFDTWSNLNDVLSNYSQWNVSSTVAAPNPTAIPMWNGSSGPIIQALQITIRIWDQKTNQTRQVTFVQAM
jgi:hypothetical protein